MGGLGRAPHAPRALVAPRGTRGAPRHSGLLVAARPRPAPCACCSTELPPLPSPRSRRCSNTIRWWPRSASPTARLTAASDSRPRPSRSAPWPRESPSCSRPGCATRSARPPPRLRARRGRGRRVRTDPAPGGAGRGPAGIDQRPRLAPPPLSRSCADRLGDHARRGGDGREHHADGRGHGHRTRASDRAHADRAGRDGGGAGATSSGGHRSRGPRGSAGPARDPHAGGPAARGGHPGSTPEEGRRPPHESARARAGEPRARCNPWPGALDARARGRS